MAIKKSIIAIVAEHVNIMKMKINTFIAVLNWRSHFSRGGQRRELERIEGKKLHVFVCATVL